MAGRARLTADGAVLTSGKPVRIFGYSQASGAGGGGTVKLYNGTDATGTLEWQKDGIASDSVEVVFGPQGKFFPAGCYLDLDTNTTFVDFECELVQS